jgi:hypothetical protein
MAKKPEKWHDDLRELLAPQLIKALKDDRAERIPLPAKQRRQVRKMLLIVMTSAQIERAIARTKSRKSARLRSPARKSKRSK